MALRYRLPPRRKGTLRNRVDSARKGDVLPPKETMAGLDPIDAIVELRNALAHGGDEVHTPAIALKMLDACA